MRVLLIKTSSMGDLIHTLPALTDAAKAIPGIIFDWVVEDNFAAIPSWHPNVDRVIPVALRRWRKGPFNKETRAEWQKLRKTLNEESYDLIIDAQGLMKSAFLTFFAKGTRAGLDFRSAREAFASFAYQKKYKVNFYQHAVHRMRSLFSLALGYELPATLPDFGLTLSLFHKAETEKYVVFLPGTTWQSKQWPENYWQKLAAFVTEAGYQICMSSGNADETALAERIAQNHPAIKVIPRLSIQEMAVLLANAKGTVAVDTGLGHLSAALNIPTVSIYGSTNPQFTGALGKASVHLATQFSCSPCLARVCSYQKDSEVKPACYATIPPLHVWQVLREML